VVLANGQQVDVRASATLYEPRGEFQLQVDAVRLAGLGARFAALEALRRKLLAEGALDAERKRPLPAMPRAVGIVTSPSGNAVADISTWTMHAQVEALRLCLGFGFSSIIGGSEYLQSMLEMDLFDKGQDSRVRVRSNTKADKSRSSERKSDRSNCYRAGQHGGAEDDDA
jgi:hypothetical protein